MKIKYTSPSTKTHVVINKSILATSGNRDKEPLVEDEDANPYWDVL